MSDAQIILERRDDSFFKIKIMILFFDKLKFNPIFIWILYSLALLAAQRWLERLIAHSKRLVNVLVKNAKWIQLKVKRLLKQY